MPPFFRRAALVLALALAPAVLAAPASAQTTEQDYLFAPQQARNVCKKPLKFAAGACVRRCPAGFTDNGRYCTQQSMDW